LEKKMQDRGREYQGMAKMGCLRRPQPTPQLIRLPRKVRVTAVAAGYAHTMLVTADAQLYGTCV
jgi:hypothetical protein